jgi:hypothetical protein
MPLKAAVQRRPGQMRDAGLQGIEAVIERQQRVLAQGATIASSSGLRTLDRISGPIGASTTKSRFRHFATVFALRPCRALSTAIEAFDRCIAALTACVVVALPCRTWPIAPPYR